MKTAALKETASKYAVAALMVAGLSAGMIGVASAQTATTPAGTTAAASQWAHDKAPGVMGKVTAVTGNTLTVTDQRSGTSYTVDASAATIKKGGAAGVAPTTATVADIAVGDMVRAQGTVSGTTVTATEVMDGLMMGGGKGGFGGEHRGPGVMGTISAISGNTVTVTKTDGTTYTVDASAATVSKTVTASVSDLKVGDTIGAQGTLTGTSVAATHIMSGMPAHMAPTTTQ
ncbi:MAG: hypothetical protein JWO43_127 [Candidatus Adlerbacteria bacterium]|nr:hypothetical protein [Candidatus Adlerbacteria bacterium]